MSVHVVDLFGRSRASASFGRIGVPESDTGWSVPRATWAPRCATATFRTTTGESRTVRTPGNEAITR
jgi:hypothetical protein